MRKACDFVVLSITNQYESVLMSNPNIKIGSLVEHIQEDWTGEVIGLIFDDNGEIESISVWLDGGEVVDDYIEYWEHIEVEPLPDNIIYAADRFGKKK